MHVIPPFYIIYYVLTSIESRHIWHNCYKIGMTMRFCTVRWVFKKFHKILHSCMTTRNLQWTCSSTSFEQPEFSLELKIVLFKELLYTYNTTLPSSKVIRLGRHCTLQIYNAKWKIFFFTGMLWRALFFGKKIQINTRKNIVFGESNSF